MWFSRSLFGKALLKKMVPILVHKMVFVCMQGSMVVYSRQGGFFFIIQLAALWSKLLLELFAASRKRHFCAKSASWTLRTFFSSNSHQSINFGSIQEDCVGGDYSGTLWTSSAEMPCVTKIGFEYEIQLVKINKQIFPLDLCQYYA